MALVSELFTRVARELIDEGFVRWSVDTHISNLNDALSAIIMSRPDLGRTTVEGTLEAGKYKITLPDNAYTFLSLIHIDGEAVPYIDMRSLSHMYPRWRKMTAAMPLNWTRNEAEDYAFYVYPAPTEDLDIEYEYSAQLKVDSEHDDIPLRDAYELMLFDYMMYRAYSRDGQNESEQSKATAHFQAFQLALTGKTQSDVEIKAKASRKDRG